MSSAALNRRLSGDPALQAQLAQAARMGRIGRWLLLLGLLPLAAWLALAPMASAVVANAHVKVDLDRRPVQHMEGGTVREVMVRDGQQVEAGQPLLALGDVAVDADARRLEFRWLSERAGAARLEAEVAGMSVLRYPQELLDAGEASPDVAAQLTKEQALFDTRRRTVRSQVQLLQDQGERIGQEMAHLRAQIAEGEQSLRHQVEELERNRALVQDGFIAGTRISQLESSVADYRARLEERHSEMARAGQRLIDTRLRAQALEGEYRQQASDLLKAANGRVTEIEQELRKVRDAARRQVVTAPAAGTVINLRFNGAGGVIQPREPIADIVPRNPRLVVEAQIRPEDVARVHAGQKARVRLTAFNPLTTPPVEGHVFYVSADRLADRNTQQSFYVVQVEVDPASLRQAGDLALQAGMPAEVFIEGEQRTPLQYLVEPVLQVMRHAGRER